MTRYFIPDYIFNNIYEITPDFLKKLGVKYVISDIDNTLVTYDDEKPTKKLMKWFRHMNDNGIKIAFVSNNDEGRVKKFSSDTGYFYIAKSRKPSSKPILKIIKKFSVKKNEVCVIGDQIFTDVASAKGAGVKAILVPPIKDKKSLFFRAKRLLEKPFKRIYYKRKEQRKANEKI